MNVIWTILWINAATGVVLTCALLLFRRRFSLTRQLTSLDHNFLCLGEKAVE